MSPVKLTPREAEVLSVLAAFPLDATLDYDRGQLAYVGFVPVHVRVLTSLLRRCLVSERKGTERALERYAINQRGREALAAYWGIELEASPSATDTPSDDPVPPQWEDTGCDEA